MSNVWFDQEGRRHLSRVPVPVDQFGQLAGRGFRCARCAEPTWAATMGKGVPVCPVHNRKMTPLVLRRPHLLPWQAMWEQVEATARPVWALPGMAAAGAAVDAGNVPALAVAAAAPAGFEISRRVWRRLRLAWHAEHSDLDLSDPTHKQRLRAAVDRAARTVGYTTAAGAGWLTLAAGTGLDPHTLISRLTWTALPLLWLGPASVWWRKQARARLLRPVDEPTAEPTAQTDPAEAEVRRIWDTVVAARTTETGQPKRGLPGTRLAGWHKVSGGWAATIVGQVGAYESKQYIDAVGAIASGYKAKKSMVTVMPDPDDENRATVMIQRSSPIKDTPRWAGPKSIDIKRGVAPVMVYADGSRCMYELWRPGWGVPHVAAFGTTGSAKSSMLKLLLTIDRHAGHKGRGLVADFLIDPQQGQSFSEFLDELAAPVACTLNEAMVLVEALTAEALRRNRYLAREAKWWDERRKKWRTGREWWNPLEDGPILALTIDEAHDYLSHKPFAALVTKAGRMWRKCGLQLRIATHTPLLADLGGSTALRDMLTGGFVWMGRTANSLSGPIAFNGRLPVDPRLIPAEPGMAYPLAGANPKPMLARTMREPDWYDWLRDDQDRPLGFPVTLPKETLAAFGPDYAKWAASAKAGDVQPWTPDTPTQQADIRQTAPTDAILAALHAAGDPVDMDALVALLRRDGVQAGPLQVRAALAELRDDGLAQSTSGQHWLTDEGRAAMTEVPA